jgi:RHS repeat-associated protein
LATKWQELFETSQNSEITKVLRLNLKSVLNYYLKDGLGTVTDIANSTGAAIQTYSYSAFGKLVSTLDANGHDISANPLIRTYFSFTGREWDEESGLFYYRARYYDPSIGRFLQSDPDPGKLRNPITINNRYTYTGNAPTIFRDPSGKFFGLDDLVIAVVAFAITAYDNNQHGGNFLEQFAKTFIISELLYHGGIALGGAEYSVSTPSGVMLLAGKQLATNVVINSTTWELENRNIINHDGAIGLILLGGTAYNGYVDQSWYQQLSTPWSNAISGLGETLAAGQGGSEGFGGVLYAPR